MDEKFVIRGVIDDTSLPTGVTASATANFKGFAGRIDDTEEQGYEFELDTDLDDVKEGSPFDLDLRAVPPRPMNEDVTVYLQRSNRLYSFAADHDGNAATDALATPNVRTLTSADPVSGIDIRVSTPGNDRNRTDDVVMVEAFTGQAGRGQEATTINVTVADAHMLPDADAISAVARDNKKYADGSRITSVMEGGMAYIWVMVENTLKDQVPDDEKFSVSLGAANPGQVLDFKITPSSIIASAREEFTLGSDDSERVGPFILEALMDEDIGDETLMLSINLESAQPELGRGAGTGMGSFSIDIKDATKPLVWAKSDADIQKAVYAAKGEGPMNPGACFEVMTADLFMMADGVTVAYSATSDSDAASGSASASMVKVCAEQPGMAHITVTGTATMSGAKALPQTMSNIAQIKFPVMVELAELMVTLEGPKDMNLVEGMSYEIKAMAQRAVTEDTMVELVQTDGTASPSDYEVANITIKAGEMMGMTMLMVKADDMMESENNMSEMLSLEGRVGAMKTNALSFYLWDAAVPALPIIAQLLLAFFLAIGGYRRYLRR